MIFVCRQIHIEIYFQKAQSSGSCKPVSICRQQQVGCRQTEFWEDLMAGIWSIFWCFLLARLSMLGHHYIWIIWGYFRSKNPPYQNPKQRSRRRLSSCCPASSLCPEQRRTTFQAELKPVRPWFKLLHQLILVKTKLGVFWTTNEKRSTSGFDSSSQNSSLFTTFIYLCVCTDLRSVRGCCGSVDCCSDCVFASDNVCVVCWSDQG